MQRLAGTAEPHYYLGKALRLQQKRGEAEAAFRKVIGLRPDSPEAYTGLGVILHDQGKPDEAAAACRQAIALKGNSHEAYNNLGNALHAQKKPGEAAAAFRRAIELRPNFPEAHHNLGLTLRAQKKLGGAVKALREAVRLAPDDPLFRQHLNRAERLLDLDGKVAAFLEGKRELEIAAEQIQFAEFCHTYKDRHLPAVWLYAEASRVDPTLLEDRDRQHRFHAARATALALAGKGADRPAVSPEECGWLSGQARAWLRGDLARYTADGQKKDSRLARMIVKRLTGWKQTEALAPVRDPKSLAGFPEAERREWLRLWQDVDALLQRLAPQADGK